MNSPVRGGVQICQPCADKHKDHDPIVETAIELLGRAKDALEKNNKYNKGEVSYPDYLCYGVQTAVDRVLEPLLRVKASRDIDQSADCLGYYALAIGYFLAGCPLSKIVIPSVETMGGYPFETSCEAPKDHSFSAKLTGDV